MPKYSRFTKQMFLPHLYHSFSGSTRLLRATWVPGTLRGAEERVASSAESLPSQSLQVILHQLGFTIASDRNTAKTILSKDKGMWNWKGQW